MDPYFWWSCVSIAALLGLSAFFSGSETALTAVNRATMHQLSGKGSKGARIALRLTEDNERLIGSILLGNNLVNILAASLATSLFTAAFGEAGVAWATLVMTFLVLVFAEVAPKTYAITFPEKAAVRVAPIVQVVVRLFYPVVAGVRLLVRLALLLVGVKTDPDAHVLAPVEQIKGTIALHASEGGVDKAERDRLLAALDLKDRDISEVMRYRRDIASISADSPPEEIIEFCLASPHTRIPLWRGEPENIVGVLHAKDLLRAEHRQVRDAKDGKAPKLDVMAVAMRPWFVPDTRTLDDQLRAFLKRRQHFALVVDEYGTLQGLITLEDILEEIVGDITDEHDVEEAAISREPDGSVVVPGAMTIRDLNRACDWGLPDDEATTVAGLMIHEAQTIPTEGQVFVFHGVRFEVLERTRHQITRLRLKQMNRGAR
ncbi:MAG TPA: HlyC/CorC family transporter [Thermohalobaculum sp.]|nr:HlyC/CorC family transporter [Thermohalobaculum sp.]